MQCTASGSSKSQFHRGSPIRCQLQSQKAGYMHEHLHSQSLLNRERTSKKYRHRSSPDRVQIRTTPYKAHMIFECWTSQQKYSGLRHLVLLLAAQKPRFDRLPSMYALDVTADHRFCDRPDIRARANRPISTLISFSMIHLPHGLLRIYQIWY